MIFSKQIEFIDSIESLIFEEFQQTLRNSGFELEEAIREDQLFNKGEDGNNKKLLGYARTTIRIKIAKGQPVDRTTLRDENNFHPSIQIDAFPDRFEVSSNVTYAKFLIGRYGPAILKPNRENMLSFVEKNLIPNLKRSIDDKLAK